MDRAGGCQPAQQDHHSKVRVHARPVGKLDRDGQAMLQEIELAQEGQEVLSPKSKEEEEVPVREGVDVGSSQRDGILHVVRARNGGALVGMVADEE
eukprot:3655042-Rhodomonas_salina.1